MTKEKARPTRERIGAGLGTGTTDSSSPIQLRTRVASLERENQRLRETLAGQRKLWSIQLLSKLDNGTAEKVYAGLAQDLCCGGQTTESLWRDMEFAKWLLSKRNGPIKREVACP